MTYCRSYRRHTDTHSAATRNRRYRSSRARSSRGAPSSGSSSTGDPDSGTSITELNNLSNEALLLELQQRHLSVSGSRAAPEARLASALVEQPVGLSPDGSTQPSSQETTSSSATSGLGSSLPNDLHALLRDEVRAQVASAVTEAFGTLTSASAPSSSSTTPPPPAAATSVSCYSSSSRPAAACALPTSAVPSRLCERILKGEFINLDDLLPEALGATPTPIQLQLVSSGTPVHLLSDPHPMTVRRRVHDLST